MLYRLADRHGQGQCQGRIYNKQLKRLKAAPR